VSESLHKRNKTNSIAGAAGEHYVMSVLLRMNLIASLAPDRAPGIDILVTNLRAQKFLALQVKTRRGKLKNWTMNEKVENYSSPSLFYCFVNFNDGIYAFEKPDVFIVPSGIVALAVKEGHKKWSGTLKRNGEIRLKTSIRTFELFPERLELEYGSEKVVLEPGWADKYRENWKQVYQLLD
jgi:hypothetical protein